MAEKNMLQAAQAYAASHWRPRPRETMRQARRYSLFVKVMKALLPLTALAVGATVILFALQPREGERYSLSFERMGTVENDLAMINPKLIGMDKDGLPFVVRAASAVPDGEGTERVRLTDVNAELTLQDGTPLTVSAAQGLVDNKNQTLNVSGGIRVTSADDYVATTESASADLNAGTVASDTPVTAEGKFGRVTADRFIFNKNTRQLEFQGNVHMELNGDSAP